MDSNLVQLGAYVIIILVIGGASVVKKIIEAQKRRKEMEKTQVKTLSLEPTYSGEKQTVSRVEEVEREIITESESENSDGKPKMEDILKELFNIPTVNHKRSTTIRNIPRTQEVKPSPAERSQMTAELVEENTSAQTDAEIHITEPSWEVFATGLQSRGLTEIQRAIVMSELIQKPRTRRMGR